MRPRNTRAASLVGFAVLALAAACTSTPRSESPAPDDTGTVSVTSIQPTPADADAATTTPQLDTVSTTQPSTTSTAAEVVAPTTTLAPVPTVPLSDPLRAQIDQLVATTESIRELEFSEPPTIVALSPEGITERRRRSLEEDLASEDLEPEAILYDLLGVFDQQVDLADFYADFYSASTLAFYDLDDRELVIPVTGELLTPYEQWILVHELTHALMDQVHSSTADRYQELADADVFDASGALLGLIEGEAVLVQSLFFDSLDASERAELRAQAAARSNPTFAAAPSFFREVLRFPYTDGSLFTLYLYQRGGMAAVDAAYALPPLSTEQIYEPERYVEGQEPAVVRFPFAAQPRLDFVEEGVWGARGWRTLLDQFLNGAVASEATVGWGGDRYALYWDPETEQLVFVSLFVGDSERDAAEFGGALDQFVAQAMNVETREESRRWIEWTGADYAYIERAGDRLLFVAATDRIVGRQMLRSLAGYGP